MKTIQLPFFDSSITICADLNDIYLQASYFDVPAFAAPYPGFITREGFIHYLASLHTDSSSLIEWYRNTLMPAAASLFTLPMESDLITFEGHIINCFTKQGIVYYKMNDILNCAGYGKNSALYTGIDMAAIGIKIKTKTNPAWYVHQDGLNVVFSKSEKAKKWLISFRLFLAKKIDFHESVYHFLYAIADIHTIGRKQLATNLCSLLKHYGSL